MLSAWVVPTDRIWELLAGEGNVELIDKLRHIEIGTPGFGVLVMDHRKGFSENDFIHNMVRAWLESRDVLVLDVENEINELQRSLG